MTPRKVGRSTRPLKGSPTDRWVGEAPDGGAWRFRDSPPRSARSRDIGFRPPSNGRLKRGEFALRCASVHPAQRCEWWMWLANLRAEA
jgi:hypothetical protein